MQLTKKQRDIIAHLDEGAVLVQDGKFYNSIPALGAGRVNSKTVEPLIEQSLLKAAKFSDIRSLTTAKGNYCNRHFLESEIAKADSNPIPKPLTRDEIIDLINPVSGLAVGWYSFMSRPSKGCSNGVSHNTSGVDRITSQGIGEMYRTKDEVKAAIILNLMSEFYSKVKKAGEL